MRRLGIAAVLVLAASAATGCRKPRPIIIEDEDPGLLSRIETGNPAHSAQLNMGFHPIEHGQWRWSLGKFAVTLRVPETAKRNGAQLVMDFAVPPKLIEKNRSVNITATVNGLKLDPVAFASAGRFQFKRNVPARALQSDSAMVHFLLDKVLAPNPDDERELGVIVSSISLEATR